MFSLLIYTIQNSSLHFGSAVVQTNLLHILWASKQSTNSLSSETRQAPGFLKALYLVFVCVLEPHKDQIRPTNSVLPGSFRTSWSETVVLFLLVYIYWLSVRQSVVNSMNQLDPYTHNISSPLLIRTFLWALFNLCFGCWSAVVSQSSCLVRRAVTHLSARATCSDACSYKFLL